MRADAERKVFMGNYNVRQEHPRPDAVRADWINLNGEWDFEIDNALVGMEKNYATRDSFDGKIIVPFCPESKLSGVEHKDFMNAVWYRRDIELPKSWQGKKVLLHIDACDYDTTAFVNGKKVGDHKGGYTPFTFEITSALKEENNYITVYARDDTRSPKQVSGKQSPRLNSYGCMYTRTTGIWQTVWLEAVDAAHIERYEAIADVENTTVILSAETSEKAFGATLKATVYFDGREVGLGETKILDRRSTLAVKLSEKHLWDLGQGNLYDVAFEIVKDGEVKDTLKGYFGLRDVRITRDGFYLNGRRVFGRFGDDEADVGDDTEDVVLVPLIESYRIVVVGSHQHLWSGSLTHNLLIFV